MLQERRETWAVLFGTTCCRHAVITHQEIRSNPTAFHMRLSFFDSLGFCAKRFSLSLDCTVPVHLFLHSHSSTIASFERGCQSGWRWRCRGNKAKSWTGSHYHYESVTCFWQKPVIVRWGWLTFAQWSGGGESCLVTGRLWLLSVWLESNEKAQQPIIPHRCPPTIHWQKTNSVDSHVWLSLTINSLQFGCFLTGKFRIYKRETSEEKKKQFANTVIAHQLVPSA